MRKREMTTVVTFPTTTAAMGMESSAAKAGFPGRLIPVPRELRAGCGMAWKCGAQMEKETARFLEGQQITFEGIFQVLL